MQNGPTTTSTQPINEVITDGATVTVRCPRDSRAAAMAPAIAVRSVATLRRLTRLLGVPQAAMQRPTKIQVIAADAFEPSVVLPGGLTAGSASNLDDHTVCIACGGGSIPDDLDEHLARVLLARISDHPELAAPRGDARVGAAEVQRFFIEGVAAYLTDPVHPASSRSARLAAAEQVCFDEASKLRGPLPLYQSIMRGQESLNNPEFYRSLQIAFGAYIFERDGAHEFVRFLANTGTDPNHSAEVVFGKSIELLETEWMTHIRRGLGRKILSIVDFAKGVWPFLRPYPWRQVECLSLMIISSISTQVTPFQFRNLIDLLTAQATKDNPWGHGLPQATYILTIMMIAGLVNICAIVRLVYVVNVLGQNILRDLRVAYIDRVNYLGASYFARMRTGDLLARFVSDMARLADPLAQTVAYSLYYLILMTVTFVALIILSWQLTLILLIIVPAYVILSRWLGPRIQFANRGRQERLAQINGHIAEIIYAHPMIQIFNLQERLRRWMHPEIHEFRRVEIRSDFLRAIFNEMSDITDLISVRLVLLVGSILVLASYDPAVAAVIGSATTGTVVGFNAAMGRFINPIHRMASIYANVSIAAAALRRVQEILSEKPEDMRTPAGGTDVPPAVHQGIEIDAIDFAYGLTPTLRGVSVDIPAGSSAAFVGPTGAGKTTLVNMIPRFYDPISGSVRIDGRDIREFSLPALRSSIALVSQETFLFNGTVRENIVLGKLDATDAEVEAASRAARIHDFIMSLPAGYDTIIGERGTRFSGGQRQRLAIARALLRNAPILILDEATSALDAETESEILEELAEATKGKTVISITHRLALAMRSDVIYVLDEGQIVEHGTHDELLARGGLYRKLFEDQNQYLLTAGLMPRSDSSAE
jgi:ABC-type multidrug transport system fused ATPase/permease subunit